MEHAVPPFLPFLGASMEPQIRLPPLQQTIMNTAIFVSLVLLAAALGVIVYLSYRSRARAKKNARAEALRLAERNFLRRGASGEDAKRLMDIFNAHPDLDPAAMLTGKEKFNAELYPLLEITLGKDFAELVKKLFFPPPRDTRRALEKRSANVKTMIEEQKSATGGQAASAIRELMDATVKPGLVFRLSFEGVEGGHECMVMGHDAQAINVTLPAHSNQLLASLQSGTRIEGTLESGPTLIAFTSVVIQAVAGSMPYCRIALWKSAWEIRKRDSLRLPVSLDVDFQHISTSNAGNIKMSNLAKEIGTVRPGMLVDLSLGGCCIETPSTGPFRIGDMIRFSKPLVAGSPPATLLGALVHLDNLAPGGSGGMAQRLHIQFLVIDDVSQRILVRALRQLQDAADREDWMRAQQLLQKMRRFNIQNIGSPGGPRHDTTDLYTGVSPGRSDQGARTTGAAGLKSSSTRNLPKVPPASARKSDGRSSARQRLPSQRNSGGFSGRQGR